MSRKKLRLKITLRMRTRKNLAPTLSREIMVRTRESLSNLLSMPNKILPLKRRRKTKQPCFVCEELGHFAKDCPERADKKEKKKVHLVTASSADDGYINFSTVLSVFQSPSWWVDTGANIHVCVDISLFSSYQRLQGSSVLIGNGSHASVRDVGTIDLKFTSVKIVQLKNVHHALTIRKNLVSVSLLLRDGFKVVLESNKVVMSKHG
jgi:hypothetical protein